MVRLFNYLAAGLLRMVIICGHYNLEHMFLSRAKVVVLQVVGSKFGSYPVMRWENWDSEDAEETRRSQSGKRMP